MARPPAKLKPGIKTPRRKNGSPEEREAASDRVVAPSREKGEGLSNAMRRANKLKAYMEPHSEEMVDTIYQIAKNKRVHASIRLEAATRYLDRLHGKPKEHVVHEGDQEASGDEVLGLLNNILENVGAQKLDVPKAE